MSTTEAADVEAAATADQEQGAWAPTDTSIMRTNQ
jgi:hypothetical protein